MNVTWKIKSENENCYKPSTEHFTIFVYCKRGTAYFKIFQRSWLVY